jgi:hypothetical protein
LIDDLPVDEFITMNADRLRLRHDELCEPTTPEDETRR